MNGDGGRQVGGRKGGREREGNAVARCHGLSLLELTLH